VVGEATANGVSAGWAEQREVPLKGNDAVLQTNVCREGERWLMEAGRGNRTPSSEEKSSTLRGKTEPPKAKREGGAVL
jgi:hypothetical protein